MANFKSTYAILMPAFCRGDASHSVPDSIPDTDPVMVKIVEIESNTTQMRNHVKQPSQLGEMLGTAQNSLTTLGSGNPIARQQYNRLKGSFSEKDILVQQQIDQRKIDTNEVEKLIVEKDAAIAPIKEKNGAAVVDKKLEELAPKQKKLAKQVDNLNEEEKRIQVNLGKFIRETEVAVASTTSSITPTTPRTPGSETPTAG